jgi:TRAP transporter TAXI family solute receptor
MKKSIKLLSLALAACTLLGIGTAIAKERLAFSGGPDGGTFQYFSNGISSRLSKNIEGVELSNTASAGSLENLRRVNSGEADFGISYSGDVYLASKGRLTKDTKEYTDVQCLAYLYGAPAHMVVLAESGINSIADLEGKRVAVGGAGSGAATAAQRYFTSLGLWDKMKVEYLGYSDAAAAMGDKMIDGFWVFAGFPNSSVIQAAASNPIKLLPLVEAGEKSGFFEEYPFYTLVTIPAGTYSGVDTPIASFQDSALWIAGKHVKADFVYTALGDIFSKEGLAYMVKVKSTAKAMSVEGALNGIVTPVHPGAARYWTEHGLTLTEAQQIK